jgi:hypothetical protein
MAYENKTKATEADVDSYIAGSANPDDGAAVCALMRKVTGLEPKMWGPSLVGFSEREYDLAGGKKGRIMAIGFSPRSSALVFYIKHAAGWDERLARLGKHRGGAGCLYINKLSDVDAAVLEDLVAAAWSETERL